MNDLFFIATITLHHKTKITYSAYTRDYDPVLLTYSANITYDLTIANTTFDTNTIYNLLTSHITCM